MTLGARSETVKTELSALALFSKGNLEEDLVCNLVAQDIIEHARGQHDEFVFVWRRECGKNIDEQPAMLYQPIQSMNNMTWQTARRKAGLGDLHVHDLRHTVGMRLREAGVDVLKGKSDCVRDGACTIEGRGGRRQPPSANSASPRLSTASAS